MGIHSRGGGYTHPEHATEAIDALHTYRDLIFKTSARGKLNRKERYYSAKQFMTNVCVKTKGKKESNRR